MRRQPHPFFRDGEMAPPFFLLQGMGGWQLPFLVEEKKEEHARERERERELATSILLISPQGGGAWPHPFFLFFFKGCGDDDLHSPYSSLRGWGDGRPPSQMKKKETETVTYEGRKTWMATSIPTILP